MGWWLQTGGMMVLPFNFSPLFCFFTVPFFFGGGGVVRRLRYQAQSPRAPPGIWILLRRGAPPSSTWSVWMSRLFIFQFITLFIYSFYALIFPFFFMKIKRGSENLYLSYFVVPRFTVEILRVPSIGAKFIVDFS